MAVPIVKLNNGVEMPMIGLGTYLAKDVRTAIKVSIKVGYRLIDTAYIYMNDKAIGKAINERIQDGTVKREELFIVGKLWNTQHDPEKVLPAIKKTLKQLNLDYLDLYLMNWPFAFQGNKYALIGTEEDIPFEDTWKAMEECVKQGYAKSIGLSNFSESQIERILEIADIKPVVNQVECHPFFSQKSMISFCKEHDIVVMGFTPLYAPSRNINENIFFNDIICEIASKHGKSCNQVVLRYLTQLGVVPIPKSEKPLRIKQNISIFDFTLTPEDMKLMDRLSKEVRVFHYVGATDFKEYPFPMQFEQFDRFNRYPTFDYSA